MKTIKAQLVAAIEADTAERFEEQFNKKMLELRGLDPSPQFDLTEGFKAVITYNYTDNIIETIRDEFHLKGIVHLCAECPYHDIEEDGRVKWVTCKHADGGRTNLRNECCDYFYKQLKAGAVEPGEPNCSGRKSKRKFTF